MQVFAYLIISLLASIAGAICGIGGGVIIKPTLDLFHLDSVATVSFLSGCTVLAMSVVSMLRSRSGSVKVEPRRGTLLAVGGAVGGIVGKWLFEIIRGLAASDGLVGTVQSVLMILLTVGVLVYVLNKKRIHTLDVQNGAACAFIGLALGMMSAFLGIGGGPINLAVLYYFFSMDTKTAALNSLYIILFSQITSLASTLLGGSIPPFTWPALVSMVIGGVLGGFVGRAFSKRMSSHAVDVLFQILLIVITGISCYNLYSYAAML